MKRYGSGAFFLQPAAAIQEKAHHKGRPGRKKDAGRSLAPNSQAMGQAVGGADGVKDLERPPPG
ncbi:MAG TPA: hypothetical protein VHC19_15445 [Pirellulales bacterium]|jgi:hypothetical protein|nr:hypothetical protein [Pirellulales bacterium]